MSIACTGCAGQTGPEVEYGSSRGASLNGTGAFAELIRSRGHTIRAAVRLNEPLAEWANGIVRFSPHPGPPKSDEAEWLVEWLDEDPDRWLIYVARDFDATAEYWAEIRDNLSASADHARRTEAEENRIAANDWVDRLPEKPEKTGEIRDWFRVERAASSPRICTELGGPWARGIDAKSAAVWIHEALVADRRTVLLSGDGKPLVVDKSLIGGRRILIVANGSFLLNEALVNAWRRSLALEVAEWPDGHEQNVAFVEGSYVLSDEARMPSLLELTNRLPPLRWVFGQMLVAAVFAALARAPRLGRPRPDPPSGADRPAAHAEALGALLAAGRAKDESLELLERYRLWRWPHGVRGAARGSGVKQKGAARRPSDGQPPDAAAGQNETSPGSVTEAGSDHGLSK